MSKQRILITGAHGFIGSALSTAARAAGHDAVPLVRRSAEVRSASEPNAPSWDPDRGILDPQSIEGFDAIVHLAGESIASGRWTEKRKARIRESRVTGTSTLCEAISALSHPPRVLVSASAVGYYGDTGDHIVDETAPQGAGFLAQVCAEWESAAERLPAAVRRVHPRFGVVLGRNGGALQRLLPLFRSGLGGPLSAGTQYMSWVALSDAVRAILFALEHEALRGPVNIVAPHPVTNEQFTAMLASAVHRPAWFRVPAWALRLALGELADEALLSGQRAVPSALRAAGFAFELPELPAALATAAGTSRNG